MKGLRLPNGKKDRDCQIDERVEIAGWMKGSKPDKGNYQNCQMDERVDIAGWMKGSRLPDG